MLLVTIAACAWLWPAATAFADTTIETESMTLQDSGVHAFVDVTASGAKAINFTGNDTASKTLTTASASTLALTARGDQCQGAPEAVVSIDGTRVLTASVAATAWTQYSTAVSLAAGTHTIVLEYDNDVYAPGVCDRNLRTDKLTLSGSSTSIPPAAPTGLVATPGNAQVALAWNANTDVGLAGYNAYRATTAGGPYTKVNGALLTSPAYTDTTVANGTTYYYVVKAVNGASESSGASPEASAKPMASGGGATTTIEAESMALADSAVHVFADASASGGQAINFTGNDTASKTVTTGAITKVVLTARGDQCQGAPDAVVKIDGVKVLTSLVSATSWTQYSATASLAAGTHTFVLEYDNDQYVAAVCDRNLRADKIVLSSSGEAPTPLLPDLVQRPPSQIGVVQVSASYRLGFQSSVSNAGGGPLRIRGHRANTESTMVADQVINMSDGSTETLSGIGSMIFYVPHNHWHYLGFDHYELRKASDNSLVAPDQKMGFCLGDRFSVSSRGVVSDPPSPPGPFTETNCESGNPSALGVTEGISPGYGDLYGPQVEGQYIDVTGLQPGEFVIVHRVNEDHSLHESNYNNDVASALVKLWPNGYGATPGVQVLQTCPESERCPPSGSPGLAKPLSLAAAPEAAAIVPAPAVQPTAPVPVQLVDPPLLVPRSATYFAKQALHRFFGGSPLAQLGIGCKRRSTIRFACKVAFRARAARYTGEVAVALPPSGPQTWWSYKLRLTRHGGGAASHATASGTPVRASARVAVKATLLPLQGARGLVLWCVPPAPSAAKHSRAR